MKKVLTLALLMAILPLISFSQDLSLAAPATINFSVGSTTQFGTMYTGVVKAMFKDLNSGNFSFGGQIAIRGKEEEMTAVYIGPVIRFTDQDYVLEFTPSLSQSSGSVRPFPKTSNYLGGGHNMIYFNGRISLTNLLQSSDADEGMGIAWITWKNELSVGDQALSETPMSVDQNIYGRVLCYQALSQLNCMKMQRKDNQFAFGMLIRAIGGQHQLGSYYGAGIGLGGYSNNSQPIWSLTWDSMSDGRNNLNLQVDLALLMGRQK